MSKKTIFWTFIFLFLVFSESLAQNQDGNIADKNFWAINSALVVSSIYDVESTYLALNRCQNKCGELNPVARPFIKRGRPWAYAYQGTINAGVIYYSYRLKKDGNKWWYVPSLVVTGVHVAAGTWNIEFSKRF